MTQIDTALAELHKALVWTQDMSRDGYPYFRGEREACRAYWVVRGPVESIKEQHYEDCTLMALERAIENEMAVHAPSVSMRDVLSMASGHLKPGTVTTTSNEPIPHLEMSQDILEGIKARG